MHPKFVASLYEQDIALLHLDEDLVFSSSVLPVCLPPPGAGRTVLSFQCMVFFKLKLFNFLAQKSADSKFDVWPR